MFDLNVVTSFQSAKTSSNHAANSLITSIDFSDNGQWLLSAGTDESIQLYDCRSGEHKKSSYSKKYGCHLARFTHRSTNCVYASTKEEDSLRYLSLHDNQYLRYFKGHKNKVVSLEVSPVDDTLISSASDRTVRIWDLRSPNAQGSISMPTPHNVVAFDAMGMVFAVASQETRSIALYDVRNFDRQPFVTFSAHNVEGSWQKVEFSNNSKYLTISSDGPSHGSFDALHGKPLGLITGHQPSKRPQTVSSQASVSPTSFTMDGEYLMGGSNNNRVCVWDLRKAGKGDHSSVYTPVHEMSATHKPALVGFNPKTMMMATADQDLQFWVPFDLYGH